MVMMTTPNITDRQLEVLRLLAKGETPKGIARELGLTMAGVRYHIRTSYERLGANHAAHAVALAWEWLDLD